MVMYIRTSKLVGHGYFLIAVNNYEDMTLDELAEFEDEEEERIMQEYRYVRLLSRNILSYFVLKKTHLDLLPR